MLGFLKESDENQYQELLFYFGGKVEFLSSLSLVNTESRAMAFLRFQSKKLPQKDVEKVVLHTAKLMADKKLKFSFAQSSGFFSYSRKKRLLILKSSLFFQKIHLSNLWQFILLRILIPKTNILISLKATAHYWMKWWPVISTFKDQLQVSHYKT
jgi:hypothetical protein